MNKLVIGIILTVFLSLVGVIGDFFIKLSGGGAKYIDYRYFVIGFVVYAITAFGWFFAMKNVKLATLGVFYAISTIIFLLIVGVFYFKESLNYYEIIGIIMAIVSLILLGRFA
jgi:small multidrug resistance pump